MAASTHASKRKAKGTPRQHEQHGDDQLFQQGRATRSSDIRRGLPVKHNAIFMLVREGGDLPKDGNGYGIFFRDTCFLDELTLRVQGTTPITLLSNADAGHAAIFELTNTDFTMNDGQLLDKERLAIRRHYAITDQVTMTLDLRNQARAALDCDLTFQVGSAFLNIFTIRGSQPGKRGTLHPPQWVGGTLTLAYDGADEHRRTTQLTCDPAPDATNGGTFSYHLRLAAGAAEQITLSIDLKDEAQRQLDAPASGATEGAQHQHFRSLLNADQLPHITTDHPEFDAMLQRGLDDLRMLTTAQGGDTYISAGIPWYVALFGRDSLISAFELVAWQPQLARTTLDLLARYQGTEFNAFQDEAPGKILHELRVGERANLREIPQIPYFGSVDATPWFLLLLGDYVRWTGDLATFQHLHENVTRALAWIDTTIAQGQSGFLEYGTTSQKGLVNQGWKDSGNSIVHTDGALAQPPIALVEVQAYVYGAYRECAWLFRQSGDEARAAALERQAADLRHRFNQAYWLENAHFLAMAIAQGDALVEGIGSNAGQALLTGITDADKATAIAERLVAPDLFSGWGVRTLSERERAYNPLDYQVGSVWPHDNALIALGMRRSGCAAEASQIFTSLYEAAMRFPHYRLPEVFDGFARADYPDPVRYPVACNPQAWAAGAFPLLLRVALGWEADALQQRLFIHQPTLPPFLNEVEVHGLRVGQAQVDLRYERQGDATRVQVLAQRGDIEVSVAP